MKELREALKNLPEQLALKFDMNTIWILAAQVMHFTHFSDYHDISRVSFSNHLAKDGEMQAFSRCYVRTIE